MDKHRDLLARPDPETDVCDDVCDSSTLSGHQRDRCAILRQLRALRPSFNISDCKKFIERNDICSSQVDRLWIHCGEDGRVSGLAVLPELTFKEIPPGSGPSVHGCHIFFQGTLSPALGSMDMLRVLQTSAPSTHVLVRGERVAWDHDLYSGYCGGKVVWEGANITGTIPSSWGQLNVSFVDFSGNQLLMGTVPPAWGQTGARVLTAGTQLTDHTDCRLDCFSSQLTGPERDKCGLWYQMRQLAMREEWLPPCETFIMGSHGLCQNRFLWVHSILINCDESGRVLVMAMYPIFRNSMNLSAVQLGASMDGGSCTGFFQGELSPELGALDKLYKMYFEAPPAEICDHGLLSASACLTRPLAINQSMLNCSSMRWVGNNISGRIPTTWDKMVALRYINANGNRDLSGPLPSELLTLRRGQWAGADFRDTGVIPLGPFSVMERDRLCKKSQRLRAAVEWSGDQGSYFFTLTLTRSSANRSLGQLDVISSPDVFYCGKNPHALAQAVALWCTFAILMVVVTLVRRYWWRRRTELMKPRPSRMAHLLQGMVQQAHRWRIPWFVLLTLYDLVADLLLAYSMYPSWTTWFIMGGFFLPNVICSATISILGFTILKEHWGLLLAYLFSPLMALMTFSGLPLLTAYLWVRRVAGRGPPSGGVSRYWLALDVDRLVTLFMGVTAATEDVVTTVFTTVGFVLMASTPWKLMKANVYFPLWSFWLSMLTSQVHMLVAWWEAVANMLEYRGLGWVREAFTEVYCPRGPQAPMKGPSLEVPLEISKCRVEEGAVDPEGALVRHQVGDTLVYVRDQCLGRSPGIQEVRMV